MCMFYLFSLYVLHLQLMKHSADDSPAFTFCIRFYDLKGIDKRAAIYQG